MNIKAEWTNEDALSANEITSSEACKNISNIDLDRFEKATTVNPDEALVIKTTQEYAQYIAQGLKDELNVGRPVVVVLRKDMDAYVVKKSDLKIETAGIKHGKWVEYEKGMIVTSYKCSLCGRIVRDDTGYDVVKDYPYCHCGAKMDGEINNEE